MPQLEPILDQLIDQFSEEESRIESGRLAVLDELTGYIRTAGKSGQTVRLNFICTHNSRRSQMAQIWAHTAAVAFQVPHIEVHSGGTEVTEFNPWAVKAMKTLGFRIDSTETDNGSGNPRYHVHIGTGTPALTCYSKRFDDVLPADTPFAAVMTCSDADRNCPVVPGAALRIPITYEDPKQFDGSGREQQEYLRTAIEIGREMIRVFQKV
ncbi:protein-tyrosine-phosphatase [Balneolales bacterium ANBcel1]|nr:protein-tyrosine-phosphatase [Balneolales bacterium ANBcel1]